MSLELMDDDSIQKLKKKNELLKTELKLVKEKNEEQNLEIVKMMVEVEDDNKKLHNLNQKINSNFNRIIKLIQRIIELKEPGYIDHTEQMIIAAEYIAKQLKLKQSCIDNLKLAIYIHEIGIIAIPDNLINTNESELSKEELKRLHQQSLIGTQLLEKEEGFEQISIILKYMNEHVDGSGIPNGLSGDNIPIESKILLTIDTFSSLIYKKKNMLSVKNAFKYMNNKKGIVFDEIIISVLYDYIIEKKLINDTPKETAISINELCEDMILARDLYTCNNILLAPLGTTLTDENIDMIKKFHLKAPILGSIYIAIDGNKS